MAKYRYTHLLFYFIMLCHTLNSGTNLCEQSSVEKDTETLDELELQPNITI